MNTVRIVLLRRVSIADCVITFRGHVQSGGEQITLVAAVTGAVLDPMTRRQAVAIRDSLLDKLRERGHIVTDRTKLEVALPCRP